MGSQIFDNCSNLVKAAFEEENLMTSLPAYTFRDCTKLTDVTLPVDLITVGDYAFAGDAALPKIDLPKGVQTIGNQSFYNCTSLAEAELPKHLKTIGVQAFLNCTSLTSPEFPDSLVTINNSAYQNCDSITRIELPESLTTLGTSVFYDCDKLALANLQNATSLTNNRLPADTFFSCDKLEVVLLPENLKTIGSQALMNCTTLQSIDLPHGLTTIESEAFRGDKKLAVFNQGAEGLLTLPSTVTTVGGSAFRDCDALVEAIIPENVTSLGTYALADNDNLEIAIIEGDFETLPAYLFQNDPKLKQVILNTSNLKSIPDYFLDSAKSLLEFPLWEGLESIGAYAFRNCTSLTEADFMTAADTLTKIGDGAYYGCTGLTAVELPDSVTTLGASAFYGCTGLTSAVLSDGLTELKGSVFSQCTNLEEVTLPENLKNIRSNAFYNCKKLQNVDFPDTVETIEDWAFYNCDALTGLELPESLTTLGQYAFRDCDNLVTVTMENNVTSMGLQCFYHCDKLESVKLSDELTTIPQEAFSQCVKLSEFNWPKKLTTIGSSAFYNCDSITGELALPDGLTTVNGSAFSQCDGITSVTMPDTVTTLGTSAFSTCTKLEKVQLSDNIKTIQNNTFYKCVKLTEVDWPDNLTAINYRAFYDCDGLVKLDLQNAPKLEAIGNEAFYSCSKLEEVQFPDSLKTIGSQCFEYCSKLKTLDLSASKQLNTISSYAFRYDNNLEEIKWPESTTEPITIGYQAFYQCYQLKEAMLPDTVTTIGEAAFRYCNEMTTVKIPRDVTSIGNNAFSDCKNLENMIWDAKDGAINTFSSGTHFTLTLGKNVDNISSAAMTTLINGGADMLAFEGENFLTLPSLIGTSFPRPLNNLPSGEYFADENGALYAVNSDGTATLVYVPDGLTEYTIPATVGMGDRQLTVTGVKNNALYLAQSLTTLTVEKPENLTSIDAYAFAYAENLASVNGQTTKSGAAALFTNAAIGAQPFYKTRLEDDTEQPAGAQGDIVYNGGKYSQDEKNGWPNTGADSSLEVTISEAASYSYRTLDEDGEETIRRPSTYITQNPDTGEWLAFTGEAIMSTVTINNKVSEDTGVDPGRVRIYFQNEDGAIFNYSVGEQWIDGKITHSDGTTSDAKVKMTVAQPTKGSYYVEFDQIPNGFTTTIDFITNYPSPTTDGGNTQVWAEYLTSAEAAARVNVASAPPEKYHELNWITRRDPYEGYKRAATSSSPGITIENGEAKINQHYYYIQLNKPNSWTQLNVGRDNVASVDFEDILTLPEGVKFAPDILADLQAGRATYTGENGSSKYINVPSRSSSIIHFETSTGNPERYGVPKIELVDDGENNKIKLTWTYNNANPNYNKDGADIGRYYIRMYVNYDTLRMDLDKVDLDNLDKEYIITNELEATLHYCYSDDDAWEDSAQYKVKASPAKPKVEKNGSPGNRGVYAPWTITLGNEGMLPVTTKNYTWIDDYIDCKGSSSYHPLYQQYMSAENIWALLTDDEWGKAAQLAIRDCCLYGAVNGTYKSVLLTDGKSGTTDYTNTSANNESNLSRNYQGMVGTDDKNDPNVAYSNAMFMVGWNDAGRAVITLYASSTATPHKTNALNDLTVLGQAEVSSAADIQRFFEKWGFFVTHNTVYQPAWDLTKLESFEIKSGETKTITVPTTNKDSFMYMVGDQSNGLKVNTRGAINDDSTYNYSYTNYVYLKKDRDMSDSNYVATDDAAAKVTQDVTFTKKGAGYQTHIYYDEYTGEKDVWDVAEYTLTANHMGAASYDVMPVTDHMSEKQRLMVPVAGNEDASWVDAATLYHCEVDDADYYILDRAGTYAHVWTGNAYADHVIVSYPTSNPEGDPAGAFDTYIFWYMQNFGGDSTRTITYKAKVQQNEREDNAFIYIINNQAWLNDHVDNRLHATTYGTGGYYATIPFLTGNPDEMKRIVDYVGDTSEGYTFETVTKGRQVIYRLRFENSFDHNFTLSGKEFYDVLPSVCSDIRWTKDNVKIDYVNFTVSDPDNWTIVDFGRNTSGSLDQRIKWADDFTMKCTNDEYGFGYIYVTVDFPDELDWDTYVGFFQNQLLHNTMYAKFLKGPIESENWKSCRVDHDLADTIVVRLQKGVFATGGWETDRDVYSTTDTARTVYANDDSIRRKVYYYITVYNDGNTNLYLSPVQDVLPEGFTMAEPPVITPCNVGYSSYYAAHKYADRSHATVDGARSYLSSGSTNLIQTTTDTTADGRQRLTMTLQPSGQYNTRLNLYYLRPKQAAVIRVACYTNKYEDSLEHAWNNAAMPVRDVYNTGVEVSDAVITSQDVTETADSPKNDGDCDLIDSVQASAYGYQTGGWAATTPWLQSNVMLTRGEVTPAIVKTIAEKVQRTEEPNEFGEIVVTREDREAYPSFAHPLNGLVWQVTAMNDGEASIADYVLSDELQWPFYFSGDVTFQQVYNDVTTVTNTDAIRLFTIDRDTWKDSNDFIHVQDTMTFTTYRRVNGAVVVDQVYPYTIGDEGVEMEIPLWRDEMNPGVAPKIRVSIDQDTDMETLNVRFVSESMVIPLGGYVLLRMETENLSKIMQNRLYFNSAYVTPVVESWEGYPSNGNIVRHTNTLAESTKAVHSIAQIPLSFSTVTTAIKGVQEIRHPANMTDTQQEKNYITLENRESEFRYTLTVDNQSGVPVREMVLIDTLPDVGDHSVFQADDLRGSAFTVLLSQNPDFELLFEKRLGSNEKDIETTTVDPSLYTIQFSAKTEFDNNDWYGRNEADWVTWEEISSLEAIRSLRLIYNDPADRIQNQAFEAFTSIQLRFNARVKGDDPRAIPGSIAWNSFGYHYTFFGYAYSLEAAPLKVGVRIPDYPHLTKALVNARNRDFVAEQDETFAYVLYTGEKITMPESATADEMLAAIEAAKRSYVRAEITVEAGKTLSEVDVSVNNRNDARIYDASAGAYDGGLWSMVNGQRFTLLELPRADGTYASYTLGGATRKGDSYTFTYQADDNPLTIDSVNMHNDWSFQIVKNDQFGTAIGGAVFAVYTTSDAEKIDLPGLEALNATLTTQLSALPDARETFVDEDTGEETIYNLMAVVEIPGYGSVQFDELHVDSYLIQELASPKDYYRLDDTVYRITRDEADSRAVVVKTVVNPFTATNEVPLLAKKLLVDRDGELLNDRRDLRDEEFTFKVEGYDIQTRTVLTTDDENCPPLPANTTAMSDANGDILFDRISFTAEEDIGKTYWYQITEVQPEVRNTRITYDETPYLAEVTVVDAGEGQIGIEVRYSYFKPDGDRVTEDVAAFRNVYQDKVDIRVPIHKDLQSDKGWHNGETYPVRLVGVADPDAEGDAVVDETDLTLLFGDTDYISQTAPIVDTAFTLTYTEADIGRTYVYEMAEVIPDTAYAYNQLTGLRVMLPNGTRYLTYGEYMAMDEADRATYPSLMWKQNDVRFDMTVHTVTVTVDYDAQRDCITASMTVDGAAGAEEATTFVNKYDPDVAKADVFVTKIITGRPWLRPIYNGVTLDSYTFQLVPADEETVMPEGTGNLTSLDRDDYMETSELNTTAKGRASNIARIGSFGTITYTRDALLAEDGETYLAEKDFYYTIVELDHDGADETHKWNHVTYDAEKQVGVKVHVWQDAEGNMNAEVFYITAGDGDYHTVDFDGLKQKADDAYQILPETYVNRYEKEPTSFEVEITKLLDEAALSDGASYQFDVYHVTTEHPEGQYLETLTFTGDGSSPSLTFTVDENWTLRLGMELEINPTTHVGGITNYTFYMVEKIPDEAAGFKAGNDRQLAHTWAEATDAEKADKTISWIYEGVKYDLNRFDINVNVRYNEFTYSMDPTVTYSLNQAQAEDAHYDNLSDYRAWGQLDVVAEKLIDGRDWYDTDAFVFEITPLEGAPLRRLAHEDDGTDEKFVAVEALNATATSVQSAIFDALQFIEKDLEGETQREFTYIIREVIPEDATVLTPDGRTKLVYKNATEEEKSTYDGQWTYHGMVYAPQQTLIVRVTDNHDGTLTVLLLNNMVRRVVTANGLLP